MNIIAGMRDPHYYEMRAIESVHAAHRIRTDTGGRNKTQYLMELKRSIQLLVLAAAMTEDA